MGKFFRGLLPAVFVFIFIFALLLGRQAIARITAETTFDDAWCVGDDAKEVCVDNAGNLVPTTDNNASLGATSLRWTKVNATSMTVTELDCTDCVDSANIEAGAVTTAKLSSGSVTTIKLDGGGGITTSGAALCLLSTGAIGQCTTADASACTCQ